MRKVLREALIIALETALVLVGIAAFGIPSGRQTQAEAVNSPASPCGLAAGCSPSSIRFDLEIGLQLPD